MFYINGHPVAAPTIELWATMKLLGVPVFTYLLFSLPTAFGTHSSTANATGHCKAGPWAPTPMIGLPGRNGRDGPRGRDGLPGPPGPRGPSGIGLGEIREIVRLIAEEEVGNLTTIVRQNPVKVVVNCADSSLGAVNTPTQAPFNQTPSTPTTELPVGGMLTYECANTFNRNCPGLTFYNPANSCRDVYLCNRLLPSGNYWVRRRHGSSDLLAQVYCYMSEDMCGIAGLMRVGYSNITNTTTTCPNPLTLYNASGKLLCGPTNRNRYLCDHLTFHTYHIPYNFVCGRAVGYGYYINVAFHYSTSSEFNTINSAYLSGLSITNQYNRQRSHIWSYAAGQSDSGTINCPCALNAGRAPPSFVGPDYYCESGTHTSPSEQWYTSTPLWDGKGCYSGSNCCNPTHAPWFRKFLKVEATSDIEVRWCHPHGNTNDKIGIELLEVYVY